MLPQRAPHLALDQSVVELRSRIRPSGAEATASSCGGTYSASMTRRPSRARRRRVLATALALSSSIPANRSFGATIRSNSPLLRHHVDAEADAEPAPCVEAVHEGGTARDLRDGPPAPDDATDDEDESDDNDEGTRHRDDDLRWAHTLVAAGGESHT
jgi:hypothetical protein